MVTLGMQLTAQNRSPSVNKLVIQAHAVTLPRKSFIAAYSVAISILSSMKHPIPVRVTLTLLVYLLICFILPPKFHTATSVSLFHAPQSARVNPISLPNPQELYIHKGPHYVTLSNFLLSGPNIFLSTQFSGILLHF